PAAYRTGAPIQQDRRRSVRRRKTRLESRHAHLQVRFRRGRLLRFSGAKRGRLLDHRRFQTCGRGKVACYYPCMRHLLLLSILALPLASIGADKSTRQPFIGSWNLVSYELRSPSGELSYPYGKDFTGRLSYDAEGHMTAQMMRRDQPKFASDVQANATPDEMA